MSEHDPYALWDKVLPDGRLITVNPMTYGKARINVAPHVGSLVYDDGWCYESPLAAIAAAEIWDGEGEPVGWFRNPQTGRRRPDGDPTKEYVYH